MERKLLKEDPFVPVVSCTLLPQRMPPKREADKRGKEDDEDDWEDDGDWQDDEQENLVSGRKG